MGHKLLAAPTNRFNRDEFVLFDDFVSFTDTKLWTVAVVATGTAAHEGPGRSNFKLFSTAANDAAVLATTNELFKFIANKAIVAECKLTYTDPNTDDGAVGFGFADALAATVLADTTGAITINDSGAMIYKIGNELVWRFATEIAGVNVTSVSSTACGGGTAQTLRIEIVPRSSTVFEARPFVDGVQLKTSAGVPIKHDITLGTSTDMDFGALIKGFHADDMTCLVDYVYAAQLR